MSLVSLFCAWDGYLSCTVFGLIPGSAEASNKGEIEDISAEVCFSFAEEMQTAGTLFPNLGQLRAMWKPEFYCVTLIPQSRSGITCQTVSGKLQHFRGEGSSKILCDNLLQCESTSYLSLSEIVCNKFPTDTVSASNCFYCILKAFHTCFLVLFTFYVLLWVTFILKPTPLSSLNCVRKLLLCLEGFCQLDTSFRGI